MAAGTSPPAPAPRARAVRALHRVEDALLTALFGGLLLLAPLQLVLRNAFDAGIPWVDPLLRALVLWVGLLGALVASRGDRHITVDVVSRALPDRARDAARVVTGLFTAAVSAVVAFHGARFVASERAFGGVAFAGIPTWVLESVIPVAFGLIALRYAVRVAIHLRALFSAGPKAE